MADEDLDLLTDLMRRARAAGADAADAVFVQGQSVSVSYRLGKLEDVERAEGRDLGLRVFVGARSAQVSTNDFDPARRQDLVERAVAMARLAPDDPYAGIAEAAWLTRDWPDLDLCDPDEPSEARLTDLARSVEEVALAHPGVTNSEGGGAGWSRSRVAMAASNGFAAGYASSSHSIGVTVLAGSGTAMERDGDGHSARHAGDLEPAEAIGRRAAERAVRRLNPRKMESRKVPVVFDPRAAPSLLGHFAGAICGPSIARGTSFLKDRLGQAVFAPGIAVIDEPFRRRGLKSRPFDGEGLPCAKRALIEDGVLTTWLLECRSARQLGLQPTGHAGRGVGGPPGPGPSNLYLMPGSRTPAELIGEIDQGLYVCDLIGMGVNGVTGDYSRGVAGFWIEGGQIAYPVSEITVAGNLKDMYRQLTPASDLEFRYGTNSPTLRIDGMTVAGN